MIVIVAHVRLSMYPRYHHRLNIQQETWTVTLSTQSLRFTSVVSYPAITTGPCS